MVVTGHIQEAVSEAAQRVSTEGKQSCRFHIWELSQSELVRGKVINIAGGDSPVYSAADQHRTRDVSVSDAFQYLYQFGYGQALWIFRLLFVEEILLRHCHSPQALENPGDGHTCILRPPYRDWEKLSLREQNGMWLYVVAKVQKHNCFIRISHWNTCKSSIKNTNKFTT